MHSNIHQEIVSLRSRIRELQWELAYVKRSSLNLPPIPEKDKPKPQSNNAVPSQVQALEKELRAIKKQLQEAENRNAYLSAIVDEQKRKLERYERNRERARERGFLPNPELLRKLDEAESFIRRLRRDNSDLRKENSSVMVANHQRDYRNNGTRRRCGMPVVGGTTSLGDTSNLYSTGPAGVHWQLCRPSWFPMHVHNYWQQYSRPQASHLYSLPQLSGVGYPQQGVMVARRGIHSASAGTSGTGNNACGGGGGSNNQYPNNLNGERKYWGNQPSQGQK